MYVHPGQAKEVQIAKALRFLNEQVGEELFTRAESKDGADIFIKGKSTPGSIEEGHASWTGAIPGQNPPGDAGPAGTGAAHIDPGAVATAHAWTEKLGMRAQFPSASSEVRQQDNPRKRKPTGASVAMGTVADVTAHEVSHLAGLGHKYNDPKPNYEDHGRGNYTKAEKKTVKKGAEPHKRPVTGSGGKVRI